MLAVCATGLALGAYGETLKLDVLPDELWWGGTVADGFRMPLCATNVYEKDLRIDSSGNEAAPLLLSTKGRWVWCEDAFKYTFGNGALTVETGPAPHPGGRRPHPMEVTAAAANPMEVKDASAKAAETPAASAGAVRRTFAPIRTGVAAGGSLRAAFEHCSRTFFPPKGHPRLEFFRQPILNTWVELNYNQNEEDVLKYAQSFLDNGMKPGVLMIDCFWQTDAFGPWTFHAARFRDPKGMSDRLHAMGYRLMLWMAPFVTLDSMPYRYLRDNGGILVDARMERAGKGFQGYPVRWWDGMSAVWDPTSPTGRKWMGDTLRRIMTDYGVDGFFFDGAGPHEFPAGDYVAYDRTAEPTDLARAFQMMALEVPFQQVREAWKMGGLPVMSTLRDKGPRWSEMRRCVTDMIAAGQLGYPFVVADLVGGGTCGNNGSGVYGLDWQDELFVRHLQIQCLSPMIQFSGSPWRLVSPAAQEIVRKMLKLRERFAPQIERMVVDCGKTGLPILRSMDFAFPHHGYERILDQFMMGDDLLVAPVVEGGVKTRTVVIPEGTWTADDGAVVTGPKTVTVATPLERLVYFTRAAADSAAKAPPAGNAIL